MVDSSEFQRKDSAGATRASVAERPPRSLFLAALGLIVWLAVPWVVILGTTVEGQVVFVVCVVFSLIAFGISGIATMQALGSRPIRWQEPASGRVDTGARRQLATQSGPLSMKAAAVQILLIPGALAVGFTLFALIDVIVRN